MTFVYVLLMGLKFWFVVPEVVDKHHLTHTANDPKNEDKRFHDGLVRGMSAVLS